MKALSGRQPWWWAILHAWKRIENRTWSTTYRGPILLHAAKGCTRDEHLDAVCWMLNAGVVAGRDVPGLADMQRGGIVGRARIVDVVNPRVAYSGDLLTIDSWYSRLPVGTDPRWHMPEQYGFVLADVEPLPFVPWKGALGLFEVPDDYATRAAP